MSFGSVRGNINEQELVPSVLDRLIDEEPDVKVEAAGASGARVRDIRRSVRRDLEWLLNSRQTVVELSARLSELQRSLVTHGLPDFTHANLCEAEDHEWLRKSIEQVVSRFEPRLMNVRVTLHDLRGVDRSVHFRIDADLRIEPEPEPVHFDSVLELPTKSFHVQGD